MADQRGGYRQPANPAPVSGPGALSQRTDGGATEGMTQPPKYMPGLGYGEGGNMEQQSGAPIAGNDIPQVSAPSVTPIPLSEPTQFPDEPLTAGMNFGPGPGNEAVTLPRMAFTPSTTIRKIAEADSSGEMELLYRALLDRGL